MMRPTPPQPTAETEVWQPGDLAECIEAEWFLEGRWPANGPQKGEIRIVDLVRIGEGGTWGAGCQFLEFARYGFGHGFIASSFRKITPRADAAERGDAEWLGKFLSTPLKEAAQCDS